MGRIYRRNKSGSYWGDYYTPEGRRIRRSLRTNDRAVAKERLRLAELAATPSSRGRRQRLSEAIAYMITATCHDKADGTRRMYRDKAKRIAKTLGDPYVGEVTRDMLSGYIARRLDKSDKVHGDAAQHTVQKELITIRRALREAHERGVLPTMPPMPRLSAKYQPREVWLAPGQFEILLLELPAARRLWACIAALAGASAGEVERLEWSMVDMAGRSMTIPGTKRATRRRRVPIAPALHHMLEEIQPEQRRGKVVARWDSVRRDLHAAVRRSNARISGFNAEYSQNRSPVVEPLPKVSPNDLRRTFASWLAQQGVPLLTIATLMGHSSTRMVEKVYGRLSKENLETAVAALPRLAGR